MDAWWDRAERIEFELDELEANGFRIERPPTLRRSGPIEIVIYRELDGVERRFTVTYPETYPFFRLEVATDAPLGMSHHVSPDGNLCLIGRAPENWQPESDTAARLLMAQLERTVVAGRTHERDDVAGIEEEQAEPVSDYYYPRGALLIDGTWGLPPIGKGELVIGYEGDPEMLLHGVVLKATTEKGATLFKLDDRLAATYHKRVRGRWVRLDEPPFTTNPARFLEQVAPRSGPTRPAPFRVRKGVQTIDAVIFPEESKWRERSGVGWVFVSSLQPFAAKKGKHPFGKAGGVAFFLRASRIGRQDYAIRAPELAFLATKKIAVFGLGCIGAPSALEFARAGVGELRILDGDFVDAGTVIRWPLGMGAVGMRKVDAIRDFINHHYPHTRVTTTDHQIGTVGSGTANYGSDLAVVSAMLDGVDLAYDATANVAVQYFLSEAARRAGVPYVAVAGTQGGWGGSVFRLSPPRTGCWACAKLHQLDWSTTGPEHGVPIPPGKENGGVQPQGCGTPTFEAAGFDMTWLAINGVRAAVEELGGGEAQYPRADWDALTLRLRDESGATQPPTIVSTSIVRHPKCRVC